MPDESEVIKFPLSSGAGDVPSFPPELGAPTRRKKAVIVVEAVDDEKSWDRPFLDTGRGGFPIPPVIQKTHPHEDENARNSYWSYLTSERTRHLFAGGLAGAFARILTHPFDRVRTTMQLNPHAPHFASMSTTFRTFVRDTGWRVGLFRGLDASLLKIVPEVALKFAVYEEVWRSEAGAHKMKKNLIAVKPGQEEKSATFTDRFSAGTVAGVVSHSLSYPFKVVQVRLANQRPFGSEFSGIWDAFRKLYATTGILGFYRGFLVSVTAMAPAMGLDFAVYGLLKKLYKQHYHTEGRHPPAHVLLACGTIASSVAHLITYPLILPRVRLQASDERALLIQTWDKTMFTYLWDVYKEDGLRKGLYRGLTPSLAKVVPAVSLSFMFYEKISDLIIPDRPARPSRASRQSVPKDDKTEV